MEWKSGTTSCLACPLCLQLGFSSLEVLLEALQTLTVGHLSCPVCGNRLQGLQSYMLHLVGHTTSRPSTSIPPPAQQYILCSLCPKKFKTAKGCASHVRSKHGLESPPVAGGRPDLMLPAVRETPRPEETIAAPARPASSVARAGPAEPPPPAAGDAGPGGVGPAAAQQQSPGSQAAPGTASAAQTVSPQELDPGGAGHKVTLPGQRAGDGRAVTYLSHPLTLRSQLLASSGPSAVLPQLMLPNQPMYQNHLPSAQAMPSQGHLLISSDQRIAVGQPVISPDHPPISAHCSLTLPPGQPLTSSGCPPPTLGQMLTPPLSQALTSPTHSLTSPAQSLTSVPLPLTSVGQPLASSAGDAASAPLASLRRGPGGGRRLRRLLQSAQHACQDCGRVFRLRPGLEAHRRLAHGDGPTEQCSVCQRQFTSSRRLQRHLGTHNVRPESAPLETKAKEGTMFECPTCKKTFTTAQFLKKHTKLHTGETPYVCDVCGRGFALQQSYHKHQQYHTAQRPYGCPQCGRAFRESATLQNHMRIHSGEKPWTCETCGKSFRQRITYVVHRRIHTGVLPYTCSACNNSFRYKLTACGG